MNETDVREIVIRPLLERLGFRHGTSANIRTEVPLRYDKAFLGRKNLKKDPPLAGRADYICEAISYGRWAVEVKAPSIPLSRDDVEQAHTYSAHPEIAASYFLVSNGREFQLYETGKLDQPALQWKFEDTEQNILQLFNVVGYEAIKKRAAVLKVDPAKPLGLGLRSQLRIVGGNVKYGEHFADHPIFRQDPLNGTIGSINGVEVKRGNDGRLLAVLSIVSPYQQLAALNKMAGLDQFEFRSSDEFISINVDRPTIFQNLVEGQVPPGMTVSLMPGMPEIPLPIGFRFVAFSEATGYVDGDTFRGVVTFDYDYQIIRGVSTGNPQVDAISRSMPSTAKIHGVGEFEVRFAQGT